MRRGRKSAAQTPAPPKDVIYGSKTNKEGSASGGKSIKFSKKTETGLKNKLKEFKEKKPNTKITLNTLKAVYRRGLGAYSSSHRPTITGGVPNTRNAWAMARVNKFLKKAAGEKVKAAYVQDDDLLKYDKGGLVAPNGKPSNLTPEQWRLVRTPEFKAWFGDWENDPQNASKVVDENGEPLVVYHGTDSKFNVFKTLWDVGGGEHLIGSHFGNKDQAKQRGNNILNLFLNIKNIKRINDYETWFVDDWVNVLKNLNIIINKEDLHRYKYKYILNVLKDNGIDGFIYANEFEGDKMKDSYIVFYPEQIKLADGSNTTFDGGNPDIRYAKGGQFNDKELLRKYKNGESIGFTAIAHLKAKGLIPRADGTKRKSEKYKYEDDIEGRIGLLEENPELFLKDGGLTKDEKELYDIYKTQKYMNLENGGSLGQDICCVNCGWEWNTNDSDESDKYVCHQCGFNNTLFYTTFKETKTPEEIAKMHNVSLDYVLNQLEIGQKHESDEHTKSEVKLGEFIGETIALHHLEEMPDYYERLSKIEDDNEPEEDFGDISIYSIYYKTPENVEIYDFTDLDEAILHSKMNDKPFEIRNFDGRKLLTRENLPLVENGQMKLTELEYKSGGKVDGYEINEFLQEQKDEADAVLMSRKSQIMKNMICNAHIEKAQSEMQKSKNPIVKNIWNEVMRLWKSTKSEISEYSFVYEHGGVSGGCGCTKMAKGGLAYGNSHDKGGIPLTVKSTGQDIEIEGGEGVVNKRSMQMRKMVEFQGRKMTPCEVISKINEMGGGVKFKCDDVKEIIEKDGDFK